MILSYSAFFLGAFVLASFSGSAPSAPSFPGASPAFFGAFRLASAAGDSVSTAFFALPAGGACPAPTGSPVGLASALAFGALAAGAALAARAAGFSALAFSGRAAGSPEKRWLIASIVLSVVSTAW